MAATGTLPRPVPEHAAPGDVLVGDGYTEGVLWGGVLCFREQRGLAMVAPDLEPVAGELIPNLYVVSADLRGVQAGPALGRLVAELTALGKSELDHPMFDPKRFRDFTDARQMRQAAAAGIRPKAAA